MRKLFCFFAFFLALHNLCSAETFSRLDDYLGLPVLASQWQLPEFVVALRSKKDIHFQSSPGRHYALMRKNILGANCYEVVVYSDKQNQKITQITFIYANKGDTSRRAKAQIQQNETVLRKRLQKLYGDFEKIKFGDKRMDSSAKSWKKGNVELILESVKREYVMLHLRPAEPESREEKNRVQSDALHDNVVENSFGDVYIKNIPMVDQGRKGYCVPATFERVFLYYGIKNIDMHRLAKEADSSAKNGTYITKINNAVKYIRRNYGLKWLSLRDVSIKDVKKYIDSGIPLFWRMETSEKYEKQRRENTRQRKNFNDPRKWRNVLKGQRAPDGDGNHICLIIGYNTETEELAVSNSWGVEENMPSWIPLKTAKKVGNSIHILLPRD